MQKNNTPKYQVLKAFIIEAIQSKQWLPHEVITSENVLAEQFTMSRHTVRQAIGQLTNEGWLYRVHGKGTFVQEQLPPARKTIGVITTYISDYIFPAIIRGIENVLSQNDCQLMLGCSNQQVDKERQCLESMRNQQVDGLIIEPAKSGMPNPNVDLIQKMIADGLPVLTLQACFDGLEHNYVILDDVQAGVTATKHLLDLGHRRIGGIFKADLAQGQLRYKGFMDAQTKVGISLAEERVVLFVGDETGKSIQTTQYETLLQNVTAVVCYNDLVAVKLMDIIKEKGLKIPEDISIVSFDDSQLATFSEVKLTSVAHPMEALGEKVASEMLSLLAGTKDVVHEKMLLKLIKRQSSKAIDERV
ncbi:MAG: GntR family transcriptional regulator [Hyphomonadaceae bacterium]|nr:GntR family transcriptional regulator [Clostridia bacterium]